MIHRKTHLSPPERTLYLPGEKIEVFRVSGLTIGVQLCYEAHFPEISTVMALKGAEILFFPHASPRGSIVEKRESWLRHLSSRAFDNTLYVVACNQSGCLRQGVSFPGVALILGPDGRPISSSDGEEILVAELKAEELLSARRSRMRFFLPARRPQLFTDILTGWREGPE